MKRRIVSCLFFCLLFVETTFAGIMPTYRQVLHEFFSRYYPEGYKNPDRNKLYQIKFAKKKSGWTVYEVDAETQSKTIREQLFWSAKNSRYHDIDYPASRSDPDSMSSIYLSQNSWSSYSYSRCVYYGYCGWDEDIIAEYGNDKNLSDTLLESLARAYSSYSQASLWNQYSLRARNSGFSELKFGDKVTPDRIAFFTKYADLDIETCYKLWKQNPDYETLIGNIYEKYSAECMWAYSNLYMCHAQGAAKKYLKDNLFGPLMISMAKNYLRSVGENGILITNGDMDTYPLWYVQEKESFRRDVDVLNSSLLTLPQYVSVIRPGFMHQPPVKMSVDSADLFVFPDYYILNGDLPSVDFKAMVKDLKNHNLSGQWFSTANYNSAAPLYSIFSHKFKIPVDQVNIENDKSLSEYHIVKSDSMVFDAENSSYILSNQLYFLDILLNNKWNRPVYFAFTLGSSEPIENWCLKNCAMESFATRVLPFDAQVNAVSRSFSNIKHSYDLLLNSYDWKANDPFVKEDDYSRLLLCENFRSIYIQIAQQLARANPDSARLIIQKLMQLVPPGNNPGSDQLLALTENADIFGLSKEEVKECVKAGLKGTKIVMDTNSKSGNIYSIDTLNAFKKAAKEYGIDVSRY